MLRPRRAPTRALTDAIRGSRTAPETASTAAQRSSRDPCLVMWPRWLWASDSRRRGVSPAHEHNRRGLSNRDDVADLGDEHGGEDGTDAAQRLDRFVAGMPLQPAMDASVALADLAVIQLDQVTQRLDPIDVHVAQPQLVQPLAGRRPARC